MKNQNVAVGLVKIPVTDFPRAAAFYRETLGLHEEFAEEEFGWAQYSAGGAPLCLYQVGMGGGEGEPGGDTGVYLLVDDAATLYDRLAGEGAVVEEQLQGGDEGSLFFTIRDPDFNTIRVLQRRR